MKYLTLNHVHYITAFLAWLAIGAAIAFSNYHSIALVY